MQCFATYEDLEKQHVTVEEREEYEQHLKVGTIVYAGVDYEAILREVTSLLSTQYSPNLEPHDLFSQLCSMGALLRVQVVGFCVPLLHMSTACSLMSVSMVLCARRLRRKLTSSSGMEATTTLPSSSQVRRPASFNVLSLMYPCSACMLGHCRVGLHAWCRLNVSMLLGGAAGAVSAAKASCGTAGIPLHQA